MEINRNDPTLIEKITNEERTSQAKSNCKQEPFKKRPLLLQRNLWEKREREAAHPRFWAYHSIRTMTPWKFSYQLNNLFVQTIIGIYIRLLTSQTRIDKLKSEY